MLQRSNRLRSPLYGVTLIEVLVVVAVIGVLLTLLLPALQTTRESARKSLCQNNLRQIGVALLNYESLHQHFPVGCLECRAVSPGPRFTSWVAFLLPNLEHRAVQARVAFDEPMWRPVNELVGGTILTEFLCPSTKSASLTQPSGLWRNRAFTDYGGLYGVEGTGNESRHPQAIQTLEDRFLGVMLYEEATRTKDIRDGMSQTAIVAEMLIRRSAECEWINGHHLFAQEKRTSVNARSGLGNDVGSPHPGGALATFCDGHVAWMSDALEQSVLNGMLTRDGREWDTEIR